jgi:hypothetical protein
MTTIARIPHADPVYRLGFDPVETARVARTVGFDMVRSQLARDCYDDTADHWAFSGDRVMQHAAAFECALGVFVFLIHDEDADAIPADLQDWYWRNVTMMADDSFVVAVSG